MDVSAGAWAWCAAEKRLAGSEGGHAPAGVAAGGGRKLLAVPFVRHFRSELSVVRGVAVMGDRAAGAAA